MKVIKLNESDIKRIVKKVLTEQEEKSKNEKFLTNVADTIVEPYFKTMMDEYRVFKSIEQIFVIVKKIKPDDIKNYLNYNQRSSNDTHYIVKDKDGKEIYREEK